VRWPLLSRDFSELKPTKNLMPKVAVCVVGSLRTFKHRDLRRNFQDFVAQNNATVFMEVMGEGEEKEKWSPIIEQEFPTVHLQWHGSKSCLEPELQQSDCCNSLLKTFPERNYNSHVQYLWTSICMRRALKYERDAGVKFTGFDWFVRTRPDLLFLDTFDVRKFDPTTTVVARRAYEYERDGWGDWFLAAPRQNAIWFFDSLVDAHESKCATGLSQEVLDRTYSERGPEFRWREHIERCSAFEWVRGDRFHFEGAKAITGVPSEPPRRLSIEIQSLPIVFAREIKDENLGRTCASYNLTCERVRGVQPDGWFRSCERMAEAGLVPDCTDSEF